jgi:hypothetical protein
MLEHLPRSNMRAVNAKRSRPFGRLTGEIWVGRVRFPFDLHIRNY